MWAQKYKDCFPRGESERGYNERPHDERVRVGHYLVPPELVEEYRARLLNGRLAAEVNCTIPCPLKQGEQQGRGCACSTRRTRQALGLGRYEALMQPLNESEGGESVDFPPSIEQVSGWVVKAQAALLCVVIFCGAMAAYYLS
jgi:hypothetical protein